MIKHIIFSFEFVVVINYAKRLHNPELPLYFQSKSHLVREHCFDILLNSLC
jgi:hypothetical protein